MDDDALRLLEYEGMKQLFRPHLACGLGSSALDALRPHERREDLLRALGEAKEVAALLDRGANVPLGGCHDLRPMLREVHDRGRPLEPEELGALRDTLSAAGAAVAAVDEAAGAPEAPPLPRLTALAEEIPGFTVLVDRVSEVVDGRGRVRDRASPRLSTVRGSIRTTRDRIDRKVGDLLARKDFRRCLQEPSPRYRSGRVVFAVKAERRGEVRGILHDVSQSGATCFVEPEGLVAEGNALEDLLAEERREVTRVLWDLTVHVLEFEADILAALSALARLDLARGAALAAREHCLEFPEVRDGGILRFREARHPVLLHLSGRERVVPVDLRLGLDFHLLVITGPNTGGKTVALKTLGLLALMAQSGLPVPAAEPEFSPLRGVFADIGDEQSLEQSLSTFSSHMTRIARFLADAGPDTLVLLDELGSGTDPAEGAALGHAILDFLSARRVPTVVTTHLGALKTYAFTHEGVSNASVEFDVETLSPTYRLLLGQPGASNALTIAERLGVPAEVVEGARSHVRPGDRESLEILEKAQEIRSRAEQHLREAEGMRSRSRDLERRAEDEYREAEGRKKTVEKEAENEMEAALSRVRKLVRDFGRELANAPKPFGPRARELAERAEEEIRATPLVRRREEFARGLARGDEVFVPKLGERFRVHAVRKRDRTLTLVRGNLRVDVDFADVTWV